MTDDQYDSATLGYTCAEGEMDPLGISCIYHVATRWNNLAAFYLALAKSPQELWVSVYKSQTADSNISMASRSRWRPAQPDPPTLVPGDIPTLRYIWCSNDIYMSREILKENFDPHLSDSLLPLWHISRAAGVANAQPFWLPSAAVRGVLESSPPSSQDMASLKLPYESVMVVFETEVGLPQGLAWPDHGLPDSPMDDSAFNPIDAVMRRGILQACHTRGGYITGIILNAGIGGIGLSDRVMWMVASEPDPQEEAPINKDRLRGVIVASLQHCRLASAVHNLAAAVAWADWMDPPPLDPRLGIGEEGSERWVRSLQRAKAARSVNGGGLIKIRVLDYARARARVDNGATSHSTHASPVSHLRRGHIRRSRIAIRDINGNPVGRIDGVQGQDWEYVRHWIPPRLVNPSGSSDPNPRIWRLPGTYSKRRMDPEPIS